MSPIPALPLRGMVIVRKEDGKVAVWCLAMTGPSSVDAVNAVVADVDDLPTITAVLHRQVVVGAGGAVPEELSGDHILSTDDVAAALDAATSDLQQEILAAISAHEDRKRTRLVRPDWVRRPPTELGAVPTDLVRSTLAHANLLKARWQEWLDTEKQRLRRSRNPRTGETPHIMPEELSMPAVRPLPPALDVGDLAVPTQQAALAVAVEE